MKQYKVIGLMSGTSLDGVDIAYCVFSNNEGKWSYIIENAETFPYEHAWKERLINAPNLSAYEFVMLHKSYGRLLGKLVLDFCLKYQLAPDFISSHGHTIFHQPEKMLTCQIGDGAEISAISGFKTICDFRSTDVALGGQGAPLVPIGDRLLFSEFDYCLNLGGFANISFEKESKRLAFDICPVNIVLNILAKEVGKEYDDKGLMAASGNVCNELLNELNQLNFYHKLPPKSLGREWLENSFMPIVNRYQIALNDKLATLCEHIAIQVKNVTSGFQGKLLITGGGTHHQFLISRIQFYQPLAVIIPDKKTNDFKEALIFGFLGVLRSNEQPNCLSSVTGASRDSVGGCIYE